MAGFVYPRASSSGCFFSILEAHSRNDAIVCIGRVLLVGPTVNRYSEIPVL